MIYLYYLGWLVVRHGSSWVATRAGFEPIVGETQDSVNTIIRATAVLNGEPDGEFAQVQTHRPQSLGL